MMIENVNWHKACVDWSKPFQPAEGTSAVNSIDPSAPSTLDPNAWALEIMGMLGYYHMLLNRDASVTPGSAEDAWLKSQMADCVTFLQKAQAAEAAYEKANPGQTYLSKSFCDILNQSTTETGTSGFNKWWIDNLESLDGTGENFFDWFTSMVNAEPDFPGAGQSQSDLLGFAFASTMMFVDLDNTSLGQLGGVDAYFSTQDWTHPFKPSYFPLVAPQMIAYYLWSEAGSPQPNDPNWSAFTEQLGFMGNLLNPANLPTPTPTNYQNNFWNETTISGDGSYGFSYILSAFEKGQFPNGASSLSSVLSEFLSAFDDKFIN